MRDSTNQLIRCPICSQEFLQPTGAREREIERLRAAMRRILEQPVRDASMEGLDTYINALRYTARKALGETDE